MSNSHFEKLEKTLPWGKGFSFLYLSTDIDTQTPSCLLIFYSFFFVYHHVSYVFLGLAAVGYVGLTLLCSLRALKIRDTHGCLRRKSVGSQKSKKGHKQKKTTIC
ncbi:uncharacterized protein HMPREF1120_05485 [Exophiala dermatitidis NIH/UT8656]|uniref:Uncharacterized protein n=1 Tax=Exophiala dermatitidis (strain ATCC 34100 / CBS 525.76 / NIH/UT8656) TaxID=858893 RepID=H6BXW1_EXODN|nr:uncharacterized protein HMPREF1120_05485 [Exophiala dermatitidis NIH/UT8656]EHY57451.1 hypothetical protein HMPREF1120_05485 [Exophiala dermatitidis NIH/UT8656]